MIIKFQDLNIWPTPLSQHYAIRTCSTKCTPQLYLFYLFQYSILAHTVLTIGFNASHLRRKHSFHEWKKKKKKSVSRDKNEHVDSFNIRVLLSVSTLNDFRWRANFTSVLNICFRNHKKFYINTFTLIRFILLSDQMSVGKGEGRGKAILNYAMQAHWNRGIAPHIFKLGTRWRRVVNFTSRLFTHDTQTSRRVCRTQW
jgi:hypothetical protein